MALTPSGLRADIYRILDRVLATGQPAEIERGGRLLRIVAADPPSPLEALEPHPDAIVGDPDELIAVDFSAEWRP